MPTQPGGTRGYWNTQDINYSTCVAVKGIVFKEFSLEINRIIFYRNQGVLAILVGCL